MHVEKLSQVLSHRVRVLVEEVFEGLFDRGFELFIVIFVIDDLFKEVLRLSFEVKEVFNNPEVLLFQVLCLEKVLTLRFEVLDPGIFHLSGLVDSLKQIMKFLKLNDSIFINESFEIRIRKHSLTMIVNELFI